MNRRFQYFVLAELFAFSNAEDFDPAPTSISLGFALFILLMACLCYYCCRRRKVPVTFERFSNETDTSQNQRQPPRNKRRFFRRGRNGNPTVNVLVHPILPPSDVPQRIQESAGVASAPAQPMVPPPYDQIHHNPHPGYVYRLPQMDVDHVSPISRMYR